MSTAISSCAPSHASFLKKHVRLVHLPARNYQLAVTNLQPVAPTSCVTSRTCSNPVQFGIEQIRLKPDLPFWQNPSRYRDPGVPLASKGTEFLIQYTCD